MEMKMEQFVAAFADQLRQALKIALDFDVVVEKPMSNVLICGLGGSGIGGTILAQFLSDHCSVPVTVTKDYTIPAFVNDRTLVIACSYSGNTEETLEAVDVAMAQNALIACITSGGKLGEMALENEWPVITVPAGYPPRAAFGFSFVQLLRMAEAYGLTSGGWQIQVEQSIVTLETMETRIKNAAHALAESIQNKLPVLYTSAWLNGVAVRWQQQINENSKMLGWTNVYPEMNHNELVGWAGGERNLAVIFLSSSFDHPRVARRMALTEKVYNGKTPHIHHVKAEGESKLEQALYLIHLGDWMSVYLAEFRGADAVEIEVINWLKGELSKF